MQYVTLSNGVRMPILGYGCYSRLDKAQSSFFSHQEPKLVGWFVSIVEERKKNHDSSKEKKNW